MAVSEIWSGRFADRDNVEVTLHAMVCFTAGNFPRFNSEHQRVSFEKRTMPFFFTVPIKNPDRSPTNRTNLRVSTDSRCPDSLGQGRLVGVPHVNRSHQICYVWILHHRDGRDGFTMTRSLVPCPTCWSLLVFGAFEIPRAVPAANGADDAEIEDA